LSSTFNPPYTWSETFGSGQYDEARAAVQDQDNNYIIAGARGNSLWVLKINGTGDSITSFESKANNAYIAHDIRQTPDSGYIVTGHTDDDDLLLLKLDQNLSLQWSKTFGGATGETGYAVVPAQDPAGYIVTGVSNNNFYTIRTDTGGGRLWAVQNSRTSGTNAAVSVVQTPDMGFMTVGTVDLDGSPRMYMQKMDRNGQSNSPP